MDISAISNPIAGELQQVEERLTKLLGDAAPEAAALVVHVNRYQGKRLRPMMALLAGKVCGPLTPQHVDLAAIVELVHLASLVHDDVIDEADVRRRQASVHAKWDNKVAVLLGDFVFSKAFSLLAALDSQSASALVSRATTRMCEGEMRQLLRRFDPTVSEADYLEIIDAKTAELFSISCRLGAGVSGAARQLAAMLSEYGRALGMAFQIVDDCLDLTGDEAKVGKTLKTDLHSGRLTLPLIHVMRREGDAGRELVFPHGKAAAQATIVEAMDRHGAIRYSLQVAQRYSREAKTLLRALPNTPSKQSLLALADFAVERDL